MSEETMTVDITSQHIVINQDRSVAVPSLIKKSIVQRDHNIERLTFDCPRYWYGKDISTLNIYVNYISVSQKAKGDDPGSSLCENVVIDENDQDMMHFDWVITNNVSQDVGGLLFLVCAKSVDTEGNEVVHWNSHLCKDLEVQEGLEASDSIVNKYPDVIESILSKLGKQIELRNSGIAIQYRNAGENIWTDLVQLEDIKGDAAVIIESNFKGSDTTANIMGKAGEAGDKWYSTDEGAYYMLSTSGEWINCGSGENLKKIEDEIDALKGDISQLSEEIENLKNNGTGTCSGATTAQAASLWAILQKAAFAEILTEEELNAFKFAWDVGIEKYTITRNLVGCTSSSNVTSINEGSTYSETLTADEGYTLVGATVTITMGSTDISDKYTNGCLTIENVTGNIIITASAIIDNTNNLVVLNENTIKNSTATSITLNNDNSITVTGSGYGYLLVNGLTAGKNYILTISEGGDFSVYGNKNENAIDDSGYGRQYHAKGSIRDIIPLSFSLIEGEYGIIIYLYGKNTYRNITLVEAE